MTTRYACRECDALADSYTELVDHVREQHGPSAQSQP